MRLKLLHAPYLGTSAPAHEVRCADQGRPPDSACGFTSYPQPKPVPGAASGLV